MVEELWCEDPSTERDVAYSILLFGNSLNGSQCVFKDRKTLFQRIKKQLMWTRSPPNKQKQKQDNTST